MAKAAAAEAEQEAKENEGTAVADPNPPTAIVEELEEEEKASTLKEEHATTTVQIPVRLTTMPIRSLHPSRFLIRYTSFDTHLNDKAAQIPLFGVPLHSLASATAGVALDSPLSTPRGAGAVGPVRVLTTGPESESNSGSGSDSSGGEIVREGKDGDRRRPSDAIAGSYGSEDEDAGEVSRVFLYPLSPFYLARFPSFVLADLVVSSLLALHRERNFRLRYMVQGVPKESGSTLACC